jgi:hypothetical protein
VGALVTALMSMGTESSTFGVTTTAAFFAICSVFFRGRLLGRRGLTAFVDADGGLAGLP